MNRMAAKSEENTVALVALVVSVISAIFTGLQWLEAAQTRKDVHADTVATLQTSQRPYITVEASAGEPPPGRFVEKVRKQFISYTLTYKVIGLSPALNVNVGNLCISGDETMAKDPSGLRFVIENAPLMAPNANVSVPCEMKIDDGFDHYLVGRITYSDVFKSPHHTNYCFVHKKNTWAMGNPVIACAFGNYVD